MKAFTISAFLPNSTLMRAHIVMFDGRVISEVAEKILSGRYIPWFVFSHLSVQVFQEWAMQPPGLSTIQRSPI
jgi:hypothetical protein